jgi:hypothetical protein
MIAEQYRCDIPSLVAALSDPACLARYQQALGDEMPSLADQGLLTHLRRCLGLAGRAAAGFEILAKTDLPAADSLLTDIFAVATWQGWELPIVAEGQVEVDATTAQRGLLGADPGREGADLFVLDHARIALARQRSAADQADPGHWRR